MRKIQWSINTVTCSVSELLTVSELIVWMNDSITHLKRQSLVCSILLLLFLPYDDMVVKYIKLIW